MYGLWRHLSIPRSPCFVGMSREEPGVFEIARTVEQLWAFFALLGMTTAGDDDDAAERLEPFLRGSGISPKLTAEISRAVGDERDRFGAHPAFGDNCPLGLRRDRIGDGRFPSLDRPETWAFACGYEFDDQLAHSSAPRWLNGPALTAFTEELGKRSWSGAWLSLNSRGWRMEDAISACLALPSTFLQADATYLTAWADEVSGFVTGY
ncbi:MAG: hypothetical protein Q8L48_01120 [Archangium sp.]|nr:hypothetical protein [Archangium sp.]